MNHFTPPSKDEIKAKYGITIDDFDVLTQDTTPDASALKRLGQFLEPVADCFGVPTFLLKKGLIIVAIIFLPWWGPKVQTEFRDCMVTTYAYYSDVLSKLPQPDTETPRYVLTVKDPIDLTRNAIDLKTGTFPTGSGIYPFSGSRA